MTWDRTYTHTLALGVDRLGAAVIFNQADITISSLCWIVRAADQLPVLLAHGLTPTPEVLLAPAALARLKLYAWQLWLLRKIGAALEHFWPGHCVAARAGDLDTSASARELLGAPLGA